MNDTRTQLIPASLATAFILVSKNNLSDERKKTLIAGVSGFPGAHLTAHAAESSLPTHASPQCLAACRYFALILAGLSTD